jgi:hypothetical protein
LSASGTFTNGRTRARVEAELRVVGSSLEIRDPRDNLLLAQWAYADMQPIQALKPGQIVKKLRLVCSNDPEARLLIDDPALISLLQKANHALRPPRRPLPPWLGTLAAGLGVLLVLGLLLECLVAAVGPIARSLPPDWEIAVDQRLTHHLLRSFGGACSGAGGQTALDSLGQRFDRDATRNVPVQLRVVSSPLVNAFALPRATVIITAGMLENVETADQLAAVVAHQLAQLDLGQTTKHIIDRSNLGMMMLAMSETVLPFTTTALTDLMRLSYDPEEESVAYGVSQDLLQKADIPVQSLGSYFRMQEQHETTHGLPTDFRNEHPITGQHAEPLGIQPFARPALTDRQWLSLRNICS